MPQSRVRGRSITYGRLRAVAIARGSRNTSAALRAALLLVSKDMAKPLSERLFLPPVRRDLLSSRPSDAVMPVFYESALQSRGWLDPENNITRIIFEEMINTITSGRARTNEAINAASTKLEALIK